MREHICTIDLATFRIERPTRTDDSVIILIKWCKCHDINQLTYYRTLYITRQTMSQDIRGNVANIVNRSALRTNIIRTREDFSQYYWLPPYELVISEKQISADHEWQHEWRNLWMVLTRLIPKHVLSEARSMKIFERSKTSTSLSARKTPDRVWWLSLNKNKNNIKSWFIGFPPHHTAEEQALWFHNGSCCT